MNLHQNNNDKSEVYIMIFRNKKKTSLQYYKNQWYSIWIFVTLSLGDQIQQFVSL